MSLAWRIGSGHGVARDLGGLKLLQQLALDGLVAGDYASGLQHAILALGVADETASLAEDDDAGGEIPGAQVPLPEAVEAAGGDPGKIECRGAGAPDPCCDRHDGYHLAQEE